MPRIEPSLLPVVIDLERGLRELRIPFGIVGGFVRALLNGRDQAGPLRKVRPLARGGSGPRMDGRSSFGSSTLYSEPCPARVHCGSIRFTPRPEPVPVKALEDVGTVLILEQEPSLFPGHRAARSSR